MTNTPHSHPDTAPRSRLLLPLDVARGFLVGMAELVPGVSGGTVALVTGLYEQLIGSASHVISAAKTLVVGGENGRVPGALEHLRRTDWWLLIPVLVGMASAVLTMAGVMSSFVTAYPEHSRGLFLGMVAMSIAVPLRMLPAGAVRRSPAIDVILVVAAAALAWVLIGLAGGGGVAEPSMVVVFFAAAVAICALVIPGVSGSFFLLAIGLYTVTLDAVDERNLGYIAVFALGAITGLASFVQLISWLLEHHRRATLLVMAGFMTGSLRALWPWQQSAGSEDEGPGALLAPYAPVLGPALLAILGAALVLALIVVEAQAAKKDLQK